MLCTSEPVIARLHRYMHYLYQGSTSPCGSMLAQAAACPGGAASSPRCTQVSKPFGATKPLFVANRPTVASTSQYTHLCIAHTMCAASLPLHADAGPSAPILRNMRLREHARADEPLLFAK
jgi:hypothetical protein